MARLRPHIAHATRRRLWVGTLALAVPAVVVFALAAACGTSKTTTGFGGTGGDGTGANGGSSANSAGPSGSKASGSGASGSSSGQTSSSSPILSGDAGAGTSGACSPGSPDMAGCACQGSVQRACYSGPPATRGIGMCTDGTQVCGGQELMTWGPCISQVLPVGCDGSTCEGPAYCTPPQDAAPPPMMDVVLPPNCHWITGGMSGVVDGSYYCEGNAFGALLEGGLGGLFGSLFGGGG